MCQTSVLMEQDDSAELLLENVTELEVVESGLVISTLFEGRKEFAEVAIRRIDFNEGKVFIYKTG